MSCHSERSEESAYSSLENQDQYDTYGDCGQGRRGDAEQERSAELRFCNRSSLIQGRHRALELLRQLLDVRRVLRRRGLKLRDGRTALSAGMSQAGIDES